MILNGLAKTQRVEKPQVANYFAGFERRQPFKTFQPHAW
jgi:hypothetical protein